MTAFVQRNGLHVPATAAHDNPEENTVTDTNIRPMRWTSDDRLETDPNGCPPPLRGVPTVCGLRACPARTESETT